MHPSVESARSAAPVLPSVRFCGPLAEPSVHVSLRRALYGVCCQAWLAVAEGVGIVLPRSRYRVTGTAARLNSSIPSADGFCHLRHP
ncbi:hypothetical protein ABIA39_008674 [Nocardia sp. GAS34]